MNVVNMQKDLNKGLNNKSLGPIHTEPRYFPLYMPRLCYTVTDLAFASFCFMFQPTQGHFVSSEPDLN